MVYAPPRGLFAKKHSYLLAYRGLAFHAVSVEPLDLSRAEVVLARSMWAPS